MNGNKSDIKMWQDNEMASSYSSINLIYAPHVGEDVWQLRKKPEDGGRVTFTLFFTSEVKNIF